MSAFRQIDGKCVTTLSPSERTAIEEGSSKLPFAVTPYYMSLVACEDPEHPIRRSVIPTMQELIRMDCEADDPLGEDEDSPVPGLVHRYPDRVLLHRERPVRYVLPVSLPRA